MEVEAEGGGLPSVVARTPQDGVTVARVLPGASFAAEGWQGPPTPTGGGAALAAPLVLSVSEAPQTGMETAPGPHGSRFRSCGFSRFGFPGSDIQGKGSQLWDVFGLLRQP